MQDPQPTSLVHMEISRMCESSGDAGSSLKKRKMDTFDGSFRADPSKRSALLLPADSRPSSMNDERAPRESFQQPQILIVHTVACSRTAAHADHHPRSSYFDCPRLFTGDHKASALRGRYRIDNVEEYIEQHEELYMVINRVYSCEVYHESVRHLFGRLQLPHQNVTIGSKIRPYLFCLTEDAGEASWASEDMRILSVLLQETLSNFGCAGHMIAPYLPLYHVREHITEYLRIGDAEGHQLLERLMAYVYKHFDEEYAEADMMFAAGLVSWKHFSKMFRSNEVVVAAIADQPQAFVTKRIDISSRGLISFDCSSWTFDGRFRRKNTRLSVKWPGKATDVLQIHDFNIYPLRLDNTQMEDRLRKRGHSFWSFRVKKFVGYNSGSFSFEEQTANPRYMIDMHTYYEMHPKDAETGQEGEEVMPEFTDPDEMPEDPFPLLLPPTVLGFGFHDKKWRDLVVENIKEVPWKSTAFERLVLSAQKKKIIRALVSAHVATTTSSTDIVDGKGNGLIMLLHGSPGTGKTLTAESIAEVTEKPLYRVTCGDIGTEPEAVEKYLESVLYIGTTWGCVVLLDEADVFLEERTQSDLQRNALVSVFLRVLEYYEGILILTSNRVGIFDEGFKSRIQLAIHYPRLDYQERLTIWTSFINDLDEADTDVEQLRNNIPRLAQNNLNGRQIRNLVKSARQLAYHERQELKEGKKLSYEHFQDVIDVSNEFETYLEKLHGHKDSDWAKDLGIRAD